MMNKVGQHILLKCCVPMSENNISFVIGNEEWCS